MHRLLLLLPLTACQETGIKVDNTDPEITLTYPAEEATLPWGEPITPVALCEDGQDPLEELRFAWSLDGAVLDLSTTILEDGVSIEIPDVASGDHSLHVTAIDTAGASAEDSVSFSVKQNSPPTVGFLAPEEGATFATEKSLRVEVQAADPDLVDPSALAFTWGGIAAGVAEAPANPDSSGYATFYVSDPPAGDQELRVTVTDAQGATGTAVVGVSLVEGDGDGDVYVSLEWGGEDCDDDDADVFPSADETCDGEDEDCDGAVDESAIDAPTWYADADGDTWGSPSAPTEACTAPTGMVTDASDCNDADAAIHPGAAETCDGVDDDCDGVTDEPEAVDASPFWADADADTYGDPSVRTTACTPPAGWVTDATDCDDAEATVHPGATETCDDVDEDCDGLVDDSASDAPTWSADADGDGWGDATTSITTCDAPAGTVTAAGDCDDGDASVHPSATETCNDVDDDCNGLVDDSTDASTPGAATWYADADGDGYGDAAALTVACDAPAGWVADATDCDDTAPHVHPGASETNCADPTDYNCDGSTGFSDADGDGIAACDDCDDTDDAVNPSATEVCDGRDNDCDGTSDEDDATDAPTWCRDTDGDGHGVATSTLIACEAPLGWVGDGTDCDDTDDAVYPTAAEECNGQDDDCDGVTDEDDAIDVRTWYRDADGDCALHPCQLFPSTSWSTPSTTGVTMCASPSRFGSPPRTSLC